MVTEYCTGESLEKRPRFESPLEGLQFFQQIVAGVGHAHAHEPPVYHLDLKPENILLRDGIAVVADFGICFIEDNEVTLTKEGFRGSRYYCAPELRNPKITGDPQPAAADVYSLGKLLYWLFTGDVYDSHEDDYGDESSRKLAHLFPALPQFTFVDELVAQMVRRNPTQRIVNANRLENRLQAVVNRIEAGGRVLDLRVPQQCLYCATGHYRAAHDQIPVMGYPRGGQPKFPDIERRRLPDNQTSPEMSIYATIRAVQRHIFGTVHLPNAGMPVFLICDYCGNVQFFLLDATQDGHGENWRP